MPRPFILSFSLCYCLLTLDRTTFLPGLVTNPLPAYSTLRNATLAQSNVTVELQPGILNTPQLPAGTGAAIDIEISLALPAADEVS